MSDDQGDPIERSAFLVYRAAYRLVRDELDRGADRARIGRRLPESVEHYAKARGWDRDPELMELMRRGAEDAAEGRRPAY